MFNVNQEVIIQSTEELPTKYNGDKGWIWKQHPKYTEFYLVLVKSAGEVYYFHQSQLILKGNTDEVPQMQ